MIENVDRRVLAGFRCVDAMTGRSILAPLAVTTAPLVITRNRSGIFAVSDAPGLHGLTTQFLAPASWPAPSSYQITIQDPALRYLPRRAQIIAPQPLPPAVPLGSAAQPSPTTTTSSTTTTTTAAPATTAPATTTPPPATTAQGSTAQTSSGIVPQDVYLYPTPAAPVAPNWALIRASVVSSANPPAPLPWTVIQVSGVGNPPPTAITNQAGEALIAIPGLGLELSSSSTGSVTETTTPATITAWFDPSVLSQPAGWVANPDDILTNLSSAQWKSASQSVQLGPGQTVYANLTISL
ncbi:MAG: hypothetical protein WBY93_12525 [Candidatus Binatus sp.]